jgi:hypothetical protein
MKLVFLEDNELARPLHLLKQRAGPDTAATHETSGLTASVAAREFTHERSNAGGRDRETLGKPLMQLGHNAVQRSMAKQRCRGIRIGSGAKLHATHVQMTAAHLPTISQQGQVFSVEDVDVAVRVPLSAIAACIDPMAFATATGDSTSAMLTTAESIDLKIGMGVSAAAVLMPCAALCCT